LTAMWHTRVSQQYPSRPLGSLIPCLAAAIPFEKPFAADYNYCQGWNAELSARVEQ
jgi:hypothetical protein